GEGWQYIAALNCYRQTRRSNAQSKRQQLRTGTTLQVVLHEADPLAARLTFTLDNAYRVS
ncbi:MAG: hypothetical protein EBR79_03765, partial [Proteobacteria bacterium]|nr:hypothetical protein [Pseudomonadota bacterium]